MGNSLKLLVFSCFRIKVLVINIEWVIVFPFAFLYSEAKFKRAPTESEYFYLILQFPGAVSGELELDKVIRGLIYS